MLHSTLLALERDKLLLETIIRKWFNKRDALPFVHSCLFFDLILLCIWSLASIMAHRESEGIEVQPKWRLLFCFVNYSTRHDKNGPNKLSKRANALAQYSLRPRNDNPSLTTYEDSTFSEPIVDHLGPSKPHDSASSASSYVKASYTYTELGNFIDRSKKQHEQVCVDDYRDSDAASTYYVNVKKDGEHSIVSAVTLPNELQSKIERLGAQQRRKITVASATTESFRMPPSFLPGSSAESISLRSLYYDYGNDDHHCEW